MVIVLEGYREIIWDPYRVYKNGIATSHTSTISCLVLSEQDVATGLTPKPAILCKWIAENVKTESVKESSGVAK
jgi:hypothetical protein